MNANTEVKGIGKLAALS